MPKALFDFTAIGREVTFENLSTDADGYSWNFGDGSPASNLANPTHIYVQDGKYLVTLTAHKAGSTDSILSFALIITEENRMNIPIREIIKYEAPSLVDANPILLSQKIKAWQITLQPYVGPPFTPVAPEDTFKEWKWPAIFNQLIAKIVIWELVVGSVGKTVISSGSTNSGGLKSIETGPSKAEWYDNSTTFENLMKEDGFLETFTQELCMLAYMAGIQLPMCPIMPADLLGLEIRTDTFIVGKKDKFINYFGTIQQG